MNRANIIFPVLLCVIFLCSPAWAARSITLPFALNFDTYDYSDLVWLSATATHTHITSGCYSGGCAKFTPPTVDSDNVASLGQFTGLNISTQLNIRFLVYFGTTWATTVASGSEGYGDKLLIVLASGGRRPMIVLYRYNPSTPHYMAPGACDDADGCNYECGGTPDCYWPDGDDAFTIHDGIGLSDFAGQWVSMELQINVPAQTIGLYIYTRNGEISGLYKQVSRSTTSNLTGIDLLGGYYNQYHTGIDSNTYMLFDELRIQTSYIGPPAGFVGGDTTAPTVTFTTSSPQTITSDSLTVIGTASDAVGVTSCKYRIGSEPGASAGTACTGTTSWTCATSGYTRGTNTLYVGCGDAAGNWGSKSMAVNYNLSSQGVSGVSALTVR